MMIVTKKINQAFQNIQKDLEERSQESFCKYENTILQYEKFVSEVFKLLKPNIVCKYNDDELYDEICKEKFNNYQQYKLFGVSFYKKIENGRFIEIEEPLINATEPEIEKIKQDIELLKQDIELLKQENKNLNLKLKDDPIIKLITKLNNDILNLQKDLMFITYSKEHKTNQYPLFDYIYHNPSKEFILENKNAILTKLYQCKGFTYWFEKKTSFNIYELIDWDNIEFLATFDKEQLCESIKNNRPREKILHKDLLEINEQFNFQKLVQVYESSSYNKKGEFVNVIGNINNNKIDWKLNKNYYDINIFTMIKASKSLINEKNSWDIVAFENAIKEWRMKGFCLERNIQALRNLCKI